ncbi:hypothetical protein LIER_32009 [Lithospermum erythrorhizon]|uniref:Uncharacterized protein n=1 Tax=Lithospermum erythrorhizon TaxID=34254 RepID=A0AAV3RYL0_LITER
MLVLGHGINHYTDPNGPMYYKGMYHLFYQYDPQGAVWGNIVWAHAVSKDLINWKIIDPAIYPSKPFDKYGCWSGSATILPGNKPIILYTGIVDENNTQVQNYAIPADYNDPYLTKWVKPDNNPLITPDIGVNKTAFRDPTTAWVGPDGYWRTIVGSRRRNRGMTYLYKSKDFMKWTKAKHPLHSVANTGNFECPDFFPVSLRGDKKGLDTSVLKGKIKHVFKVSLDVTRYEYYTIGTYVLDKDRYFPDNASIDGWNGLRLDYGNYYASKSFFDPSKNRRINTGWANESDAAIHDVEKGWAGIHAIPHIERKKVHLNNKKLKKGDQIEVKGITAAQADVEVTFSFASLDKAEPFDPSWDKYDAQKVCSQKGSSVEGGLGPFGLLTLASSKLEEYTPVFFRVFKAQHNKHVVLMCSDASRSSIKTLLYKPSFAGFVDVDLADKKFSLKTLIDNSVVESFGEGGKTCILSRVYPIIATYKNAHLYAFNNGTEIITIEKLDAWSMKSAKIH